MTNICINTLIGIPASGKSTFCQQIQNEAETFNVIHICYDDFIRMPNADDSLAEKSLYFQSKLYKKHRFSLLWLLQQLIDDIKANSDFHRFRQAMIGDFPHVQFDIKSKFTGRNYLLLVDDTMHYRSMRKEIRTLVRRNQVGLFVTYFSTTLETAISRNQNRGNSVDQEHLERMYAIIESPTEDDGEILFVNDGSEITTNFVESFALKCIECPLKSVHSIDHHHPVVEQTVLHEADLVLRRSINRKMKVYKETNSTVDVRELAKMLCAKRSFVLREIKMGRIDLPDNLDDLNEFID